MNDQYIYSLETLIGGLYNNNFLSEKMDQADVVLTSSKHNMAIKPRTVVKYMASIHSHFGILYTSLYNHNFCGTSTFLPMEVVPTPNESITPRMWAKKIRQHFVTPWYDTQITFEAQGLGMEIKKTTI